MGAARGMAGVGAVARVEVIAARRFYAVRALRRASAANCPGHLRRGARRRPIDSLGDPRIAGLSSDVGSFR